MLLVRYFKDSKQRYTLEIKGEQNTIIRSNISPKDATDLTAHFINSSIFLLEFFIFINYFDNFDFFFIQYLL